MKASWVAEEEKSKVLKMSGADMLMEALEKEGVDVLFGYPGVPSFPFMMRCTKRTSNTF